MKNKIKILLLFTTLLCSKLIQAQEIRSTLTQITTELLKGNNEERFNWNFATVKPLTQKGMPLMFECSGKFYNSAQYLIISETTEFITYENVTTNDILICPKHTTSAGSPSGSSSSGGWTPINGSIIWQIYLLNNASGEGRQFPTNPLVTMQSENGIPGYGSYYFTQNQNGQLIWVKPTVPPPTAPTSTQPDDPKKDTTKPKPYYILVDDDTTKYYEGQTIYLLKSTSSSKFKIKKDSTTLDPSNYVWKKDGTTNIAQGKDSIYYTPNLSQYNTFSVNDNVKLIEFNVRFVKKPYIEFYKKDGYNYEYGWDDVSNNIALLKEDFPRYAYDGELPTYRTKWISTFHQKTEEVVIKVNDLQSDLQKVKNFYVEIKGANSKIKINGNTSLKLDYNALKVSSKKININITADEFGSTITNHLRDSIHAITNANDTCGKLYISCEKPITKKVVFVYVKTSSGSYPVNRNTQLVDFLNKKSFNQLLRQWEIAKKDTIGYYQTELDLSSSNKQTMLSNCTTNSQVLNFLLQQYNNSFYIDSTGVIDSSNRVDLLTINSNPNTQDDDSGANIKTRFFFITDISNFVLPNGDTLKGTTNRGGCYGFVTQEGQNAVSVTHELGHALNLLHTFFEATLNNNYPNLIKTKTNNFMDYFDISNPSDIRDRFYYYQWFHKATVKGISTGNFWIW